MDSKTRTIDAKTRAIDAKTEHALRAFLRLLEGKYDVAKAILYGSRARGDHQPESDADLLLVLRGEPRPRLKTSLAMVDQAYEIELETGLVISPLPIWESEWREPERFSNPELLEDAIREGIQI